MFSNKTLLPLTRRPLAADQAPRAHGEVIHLTVAMWVGARVGLPKPSKNP